MGDGGRGVAGNFDETQNPASSVRRLEESAKTNDERNGLWRRFEEVDRKMEKTR